MTQEQLLKSLDSAISRYNRLADSKPKFRIPTISYRKSNNVIELIGFYSEDYKKNAGFFERFTIGSFDQELRSAWSSISSYARDFNKSINTNEVASSNKSSASTALPKGAWIMETSNGVEYTTMEEFFYESNFEVQKLIIPEGTRAIPDLFKMRNSTILSFGNSYDSLTEIVFPKGLEEIGSYCFNDCSVKRLYFPQSMRLIEDGNIPVSVKDLCIPSSVTLEGNEGQSLERLTIMLTDEDETRILESLSDMITSKTQILIYHNGYVWDYKDNERVSVFNRDLEIETLSRQIQYGNKFEPYHISNRNLSGLIKVSTLYY